MDVKPSNILKFPGKLYKLCDFGNSVENKIEKTLRTVK